MEMKEFLKKMREENYSFFSQEKDLSCNYARIEKINGRLFHHVITRASYDGAVYEKYFFIPQQKKTYRVYGRPGHRQKISFLKSFSFSDWKDFFFDVACFDKTGTHDYVDVTILAHCRHNLRKVLDRQLSDGIFENCYYGKIEELQ